MYQYVIRRGVTRELVRFGSDECDLKPGERVIARTERGRELAEVVLRVESSGPGWAEEETVRRRGWIEARASASDLEIWRGLEAERQSRFEICASAAREGDWPIEPIDAEPLFDRTVLHYLGPRRFDGASDLVARLRVARGLDVYLEAVGLDESDLGLDMESATATATKTTKGCGSCGEGCGSCGEGRGSCSPGGEASKSGCATCPLSR